MIEDVYWLIVKLLGKKKKDKGGNYMIYYWLRLPSMQNEDFINIKIMCVLGECMCI